MTTITINEDIQLSADNFDNSRELIEELAEANGFKISWEVEVDSLSDSDLDLIAKAKSTNWEDLDNI
ncbi:MAG: hypothetical protein AAGC88_03160 [Bacteroidota bacterium]